MALCKELKTYRQYIMKTLCSNKDIVSLLTDKKEVELPCRDLMYKNIFPYAYTPDPTKETNTFICFRLSIPHVSNKTCKTVGIVFYIFTHQSLIRTEDGLRTDLIGETIEELFNGTYDIGLGRLKLQGMDDISPNTDYHGIALEYSAEEFNRPSIHGDKKW